MRNWTQTLPFLQLNRLAKAITVIDSEPLVLESKAVKAIQ